MGSEVGHLPAYMLQRIVRCVDAKTYVAKIITVYTSFLFVSFLSL